jgi:hypothetical protein
MRSARAVTTASDRHRALIQAFEAGRAAGDRDQLTQAALALPSAMGFGVHPGPIPALLFEAYESADSSDLRTRARLAAALAAAWVYGGEAHRAAGFAAEAQALAELAADPSTIASALDAALLTCWGPDDFDRRRHLAARLVDVVAHVADVEVRLSAYLWRLTTAWECLDMVAVQRQLRALDLLAAESGSERVSFFALSRRAMHAIAVGDAEQARRLLERTCDLAASITEPDAAAVVHELTAVTAMRFGAPDVLVDEAAAFEAFGSTEGIASVSMDAAVYWLAVDEPARAESLVRRVVGNGFSTVTKDVDFLLTVANATLVASELGLDELAREGAATLEPYAGRAILNAGAVAFHGVVDDYVYRARRAVSDERANRWRDSAVSAYRRIGADWWIERLDAGGHETAHGRRSITHVTLQLCQLTSGLWSVGRGPDYVVLPDLRGLHYLRELLAHPGAERSSLELAESARGHAGTGVRQSDLGIVLDDTAKAAYRRRLAELDADIAEAEGWNDSGRLERAESERQALIDQLTSAVGLGGRHRRIGSTDERARIAVRKAIAAALEQVEQHDPHLGRLLRDTIRTGTWCRYEPDPDRPVEWVLNPSN